jgi:flagellar basal-body rod modification protein FlgD
MAVEAIGSELSSTTTDLSKSTLGQEDFIKLFLTELTFQDPLEPINNREFLAQMAQFANLEQMRITNENTNNLVSMNATAQSLELLGRQAQVETESGGSVFGAITAISFTSTGPALTITQTNGSVLTDVRLSQIKLIRQGL